MSLSPLSYAISATWVVLVLSHLSQALDNAPTMDLDITQKSQQQQQQYLRGSSHETHALEKESRMLWGREFSRGNILGLFHQQQNSSASSDASTSKTKMPRNNQLWQQDCNFDFAQSHNNNMTYNPEQSLALIGQPVQVQVVNEDVSTEHPADDSLLLQHNPLAQSSGPQPRIVGGEEATLESFVMHLQYLDIDPKPEDPWRFGGCGGALISNCHVLTAAHCVESSRGLTTDGAYIGAYKPFEDGNGGQPYHFSYIAAVDWNPGFSNQNNANDVAILTLSNCTNDFAIMEIANNAYMSNSIQDGDSVTVAGFGQLQANDATPVETLRDVDVSYISRQTCNTYYPNKVLGDMLCAGLLETGGADSCQGDSGGPLYHTDPASGVKTQIGIVSWGLGCGMQYRPGVYTSTAYHYEYIKNLVCSYYLTDPTVNLCAAPTNNIDDGQQCASGIGDACNDNDLPCCQSSGFECKRIRGKYQCARPSRPQRESIGKSSSGSSPRNGKAFPFP